MSRDKTEVKNHYYTMQRRLINLIPLGSQAAYARKYSPNMKTQAGGDSICSTMNFVTR